MRSLAKAMVTTDTVPSWSPSLLARRLRVPTRGPGGSSVLRGARRDTAATLDAWRLGELAADACVIVDELVGNVLRHAPETEWASVALILDGDAVRIEVSDNSREPPRFREPAVWDEHGRGLQLVAGLATEWAWRQTPAGTVVWAVLAVPGPPIYEAVRRRLAGGTVPIPRVNGSGGW